MYLRKDDIHIFHTTPWGWKYAHHLGHNGMAQGKTWPHVGKGKRRVIRPYPLACPCTRLTYWTDFRRHTTSVQLNIEVFYLSQIRFIAKTLFGPESKTVLIEFRLKSEFRPFRVSVKILTPALCMFDRSCDCQKKLVMSLFRISYGGRPEMIKARKTFCFGSETLRISFLSSVIR